MRNAATCILIFMISAVLTSCLKEKLNKTSPSVSTAAAISAGPTAVTDDVPAAFSSLMGNSWTVVNKATSQTTMAGSINTSNYIGKASDYFNFTTYGKLYWSLNGKKDTATYMISGDTLKFKHAYIDGQTHKVDSAYNASYIISNVTNHTSTLFQSLFVPDANSDGPLLTTINLKK